MTNPSQQRQDEHDYQHESPRETADSIIVALILAFVFRAFIIEAFVIPTGSMAATLNGAHGTLVCENCGWEFTYGLVDTSNAPRQFMRPGSDSGVLCQNCRHLNQSLEITNAKRNYESGDRILVLKWPFDIGGPLLGPHRWEVLVFKDPSDGVTNYIKRLVGLPGEVIEIIEGDVYAADVDDLSKQSRDTLRELRDLKYWRTIRERQRISNARAPGGPDDQNLPDARSLDRMERDLVAARADLLNELNDKLRIQRKTDLAAQSLWTVVYDHDYPPTETGPYQPQWMPARSDNGWTVGTRTLSFDPAGDDREFVGLRAILDSHCGYNAPGEGPSPEPVSDLRVGFVATLGEGDGQLGVRLRKYGDEFLGELGAEGVLRLSWREVNGESDWSPLNETRVDPDRLKQPFEFAMENVDYRVAIRLSGSELLATDDQQYAPDVATIRRRRNDTAFAPAIFARDLEVDLSHVLVQKDVYYLSDLPTAATPLGYEAWGTRNHPIELAEGEYFFLGDNSAQSKDSRLWDIVGPHLVSRGSLYQLGTVPRDQLIGRAFFVYWPSGLRTRLLPALKDRGWIPNFGQMRWIR